MGSGVAWAENLSFEGESLTWDTQTESFTNEDKAAAAFAPGDNVSFSGESTVTLGEDITAGQVSIASGADVVINLGSYTLNFETLSLQGGSLDMEAPLVLTAGQTLAVGSNGSVLKPNLVLGNNATLRVDFSGCAPATSLNNSTLTLQSGSWLQLLNCGEGDGKTYTLLTGVSGLVDAQGNAITLDSSNSAISNYFDTTQSGSGFWAGAILQLNENGILLLVRHNDAVKDAITVTDRLFNGVYYQHNRGVYFENMEYSVADADSNGGAIYADSIEEDNIVLSNNGCVLFKYINVYANSDYRASGGAIYGGCSGVITLDYNGSVIFSGNSAVGSSYNGICGGAIYGDDSCEISLCNNNSVEFSGCQASYVGGTVIGGAPKFAYGGAIYGGELSVISINNNGSINFSGNSAQQKIANMFSNASYGGAIYGGSESSIVLSNNNSVQFRGNCSSTGGGAIYGDSGSTITLSNNGNVIFEGNTGGSYSSYGGAIYGESDSTINLSNNDSVLFRGNCSSSRGGAIYGGADSSIHLSNNRSVKFIENTVSSTLITAYGGAIFGDTNSTITLSNNGFVIFEGNAASLTANSSSTGLKGGAIYGHNVTMCNNGNVIFERNTSSLTPSSSSNAYGRTIYINGNLSIQNNDSVLFEKNAEICNGVYRLRSIYAGGSGDVISLSAATGNSIEFRDSVYIQDGSTVNLNADFGDMRQQGDIVFSGKYTEQHLNELLEDAGAGRMATENEILDSRTTEVNVVTNLYGGRLCVEDGAVYKGAGITAHEGSLATVRLKDAALSHSGHDLIFNSGTSLELLGNNTIFGNVQMQEGSTLLLNAEETLGATDFVGDINLAGGVTLALSNDSTWFCENEVLMYVRGTYAGWDVDKLTVTGAGAYGASDLVWVDNLLILNYNAETFNKHYNGSITYSLRIADGSVLNRNYESVIFRKISSSLLGGAIHGATYGRIDLSNNGSLMFEGNTSRSSTTSTSPSYAYGGAIYGGSHSSIDLINNGSLIFKGNIADSTASSSSYAYARGGAIYGNDSVILRNNRNVIFERNTASSSASTSSRAYANGGAIYGYSGSNIDLSSNGSLMFKGNMASSTSSSYVYGGAIYTSGNLSIQNNDAVLFEKNAEISNGTYRLRSIYAGGSGDVISFSAAAGKSIEFRDSVHIGSGSTVNLNADYGAVKQQGDIIFTGKYTEQHLNDLLDAAEAGRTATAEEILNSRTTEVYTMMNLYGGRLRVEEGVIYKGWGITAHEGSESTVHVKNAELSHAGYGITISSGSVLSAEGTNSLTASVLTIQDGGMMQLALGMAQVDGAAVLTTTGSLNMGNISFDLTGTEYLAAGDYKLLTRTEGVDYDISGWTLNGATSDQLRWENGTLYYTGGHDWNHGVTDDDDISDLGEILGNLIINGGDITLDDVVNAIQDAVDAGFGHGQGHIVINRGGIHISGAGDLDGHIIFNGDLKDIRKLFIEKDITNIKIELGGSSEAENIVDVGGEYTVEIDSLAGDGSMSKTGEGEMVVHGHGHKVGGMLDVQEGTLTFTAGNETSGEPTGTETEVNELVVGNKKDKEAKVKVEKDTKVKGNKMQVDGQHAVVTNNGTMDFSGEVKVKKGHLENNGSISKVTLEGGTVSGSGEFAGLEMLGGELVVGNSPGLQTYTDSATFTEGSIIFSMADTDTAATSGTAGWDSSAYSTIDMDGNALMLGENVNIVLELGGAALESLVAEVNATLEFSLKLIQNIDSASLTMGAEGFAMLLDNTRILITEDSEGLTAATLHLAGQDITDMLSNAAYRYEGSTLVFSGTVTNNGTLTVPEPTTATLSLLALAGLCARRRRK